MSDLTLEAAIERAETFLDFAESYKRPFDCYKNSPDIDAIRTLIAVARNASEGAWQPIETAPKVERFRALLTDGVRVDVGIRYHYFSHGWSWSGHLLPDGPSHWRPLPAAAATEGAAT